MEISISRSTYHMNKNDLLSNSISVQRLYDDAGGSMFDTDIKQMTTCFVSVHRVILVTISLVA